MITDFFDSMQVTRFFSVPYYSTCRHVTHNNTFNKYLFRSSVLYFTFRLNCSLCFFFGPLVRCCINAPFQYRLSVLHVWVVVLAGWLISVFLSPYNLGTYLCVHFSQSVIATIVRGNIKITKLVNSDYSACIVLCCFILTHSPSSQI